MKGNGRLPAGWKEIQLGKVAQLSGRIGWKGLTAKEYTKEGPFFLSVHSLNYGDYCDYRDAFHISQQRYDESPEIMLRPYDVLICKDGAGIGKLGIVGDDLPGQTTINSSLLLVRAQEAILPKYLYYILSSPYFQGIVKSRLMGATTPHLYQRDITEFPIYLPPLPEQQRIVAILDEAFAGLATAIANAERNLKNARELFESYLALTFEQKRKDWVETPFEDCLVNVKYTTKIKRRDFLADGKFPIISQEAEFINGYWSESKDLFRVTTPVVIFGDHTKVLKYVDFDFVLGADGVKVLQPSKDWIPRFFYYALKSLPLDSKGYARHYSVLRSKVVWRPAKLEEQTSIATAFDQLNDECARLEDIYNSNLASLAELKQTILQKAFSGELTSPPSQAIKEAAE